MTSFVCYLNRRKSNAERLLGSFAEGAAKAGHCAKIVNATETTRAVKDSVAVLYGVDQVTLPVWNMIVTERIPYVYIDNGYFLSRWTGRATEPFYRVTWNAMQHDGIGRSDGLRWRALGMSIRPMRDAEGHVLIALQSDFWYARFGTSMNKWSGEIIRSITPYAKGRIAVRAKADHTKPVQWDSIRCVVTHSSNVAIDGILNGVPCFATYRCAAKTLSGEFPRVDQPRIVGKAEVEAWCSVLADNQWTAKEIASGKPIEYWAKSEHEAKKQGEE